MATRNTTSYKLGWGAAKASGQPAAAIRGIKLRVVVLTSVRSTALA